MLSLFFCWPTTKHPQATKATFHERIFPSFYPVMAVYDNKMAFDSSIVDVTQISLLEPRSKFRQFDAILRKPLSALLAMYQMSNGACKPSRLSPNDTHIIGDGFQAALDPDFISMKPCSPLVAEELFMGAIPTSIYSSLDVAVRCCFCRSPSYARSRSINENIFRRSI